ncbi:hypothetical protein HOP52_15015 [Halomonas campisalis]|uniref:Tripartite tricarboxylate transporter TctB family protein n=1 Tax=Billgrantia campisalis TaxID=74661 RepID=A0ABS9PBD1_9GAMM|nr:hypothetical protein [Halomonas campisalis]MCG6659068.1 hypothetical protein [Halomonas campisalis]MDR5863898.1 hypothetical protein [Halomonas campisalis]
MNRTITKELLSAALMLGLGIAGLIHIQYGAWRPAPLVPSYIMPQTAYHFLIGGGLWVLTTLGLFTLRQRVSALERPGAKDQDLVAIGLSSALMLGGAVVYFLLVLNVGLVVSTVAFNAVLIAVLAPNVSFKGLLIVPPLVGLAVWLLFVQMISVTLPPALLF